MGRQGWVATCHKTGNRSYISKRAARGRRRRIAQRERCPLSALYIESCDACDYWHVRWRPVLEAADA